MVTSEVFWNGKTVFLTGHTGFKGSWMCLLLRQLGAHVIGFSNGIPTTPALFELAHIADEVTDTRGDVNDLDVVSNAVKTARPDIIIHMAAQPIVKVGYDDPVITYATNLMGTVHVLEAARHCPSVGVILVIATDKCYENKEWFWGYRENDELGGYDPYSNSKACAELAVSSYRRSFFSTRQKPVALVSARAGNVVGGGDFADDRILPDAYRAFSTGRVLKLRNPKAIRPWQHVLDPLWAYLTLIEHAWSDPERYSEAWNFGPGDINEKPVDILVNGMAALWGEGASWQQEFGRHPKETRLLRIDASKAMQDLAWVPQLQFDSMIEWTTHWYREFSNGADVRKLTLTQIDRYLKLVS